MDMNESQELAEALARAEKAERELAEYKAQTEGDHADRKVHAAASPIPIERPKPTSEIFAEWARERFK